EVGPADRIFDRALGSAAAAAGLHAQFTARCRPARLARLFRPSGRMAHRPGADRGDGRAAGLSPSRQHPLRRGAALHLVCGPPRSRDASRPRRHRAAVRKVSAREERSHLSEGAQPGAGALEPTEGEEVDADVAETAGLSLGGDRLDDGSGVALADQATHLSRPRSERTDRRTHAATQRILEKRRDPRGSREPGDEPRADALRTQDPRPAQKRRSLEEELREKRELQPVRGGEGELLALRAAQLVLSEYRVTFGVAGDEDASDAVRGEDSRP